jgi:hypothetical protein
MFSHSRVVSFHSNARQSREISPPPPRNLVDTFSIGSADKLHEWPFWPPRACFCCRSGRLDDARLILGRGLLPPLISGSINLLTPLVLLWETPTTLKTTNGPQSKKGAQARRSNVPLRSRLTLLVTIDAGAHRRVVRPCHPYPPLHIVQVLFYDYFSARFPTHFRCRTQLARRPLAPQARCPCYNFTRSLRRARRSRRDCLRWRD